MADIWDTLTQALNVGATIYAGQVQAKAAKAAARAASTDFPQLGMGLASTGPQRGTVLEMMPQATPAGSIQIGPGGMYLGDSDVSQVSGACVRRKPSIVYAIGTTPCGNQKLVAMRSAGTPLLWSGDFQAVKRVARVARKLGRFVHHRRPR